jgi:threonine/homoserine/homoserine lactone efflux protein
MLVKGFKFGMILQIAIGPVCIFVLTTAVSTNFFNAFSAVLAAVLIDAVYIILAATGAVRILKKSKNLFGLKLFSGIVILTFGISLIIKNFGMDIIPDIKFTKAPGINNYFIYTLILTASSPLTILFWSGIFNAKIIEDNLKDKDLYFFGIGCLSATLIFLTIISALGSCLRFMIPQIFISVLNTIAGMVIIYFAARLFLKKINPENTGSQ